MDLNDPPHDGRITRAGSRSGSAAGVDRRDPLPSGARQVGPGGVVGGDLGHVRPVGDALFDRTGGDLHLEVGVMVGLHQRSRRCLEELAVEADQHLVVPTERYEQPCRYPLPVVVKCHTVWSGTSITFGDVLVEYWYDGRYWVGTYQ